MTAEWVLSAWAHRRELQEQSRQAEAKVKSLRESVDEAQMISEAAHTAPEDAEATRERLQQQLASLPLVFDPDIVAALPVEMLQAIFRALALAHNPLWPVVHEGRYNPTRASAPWRLAGVCRRWRSVALDILEIWSYIAAPTVFSNDPTPATGEMLVARMKLLLERSTTRALDILLVCDDPDRRLTKLDWLREALNVISLCAACWRRVHLVLPCDARESDLAFLLRQPTPLLEEISVSVYNDVVPWKEDNPEYLPFCPSLRTLWMPAIFVPPAGPHRLLTCAHLPVGAEWRDRLWDALCQMTCLERLSMEILWTEAPAPALAPASHLRLGRLQCLEISGCPAMVETWAQALEMPLLRRLVLGVSTTTEIERIATFLSTACAGVVDLHIIGSRDADERALDIPWMPRVICELPLERVAFSGCDISWRILEALNRPTARPVWPRLQSLTLYRCDQGRGGLEYGFKYFAQALISFVGFRVRSRHYNNGGHAPLTLGIAGIDVQSLSEDFDIRPTLRALEYVLGPQSSQFIASTGEALLAHAASDHEESEGDAALTESYGSGSSEEVADVDGDQTDNEPIEPEQLLVASGPDWDSDVAVPDVSRLRHPISAPFHSVSTSRGPPWPISVCSTW